MIPHIKDLCVEWGDYMRSQPRSLSGRSTLGRIMDEGAGAASEKYGSSVPVEFMDKDIRWVHAAHLDMPFEMRMAMIACFVPRVDKKQKAQGLSSLLERRVSISVMFEMQNHVIAFVAGREPVKAKTPDLDL